MIQKTMKEKKFCSDICRARASTKNRYEKLKTDGKFKEQRSEYFKEWYKKNKTKHNLNMREYMREYFRKNYSKKAKEEKESENISK